MKRSRCYFIYMLVVNITTNLVDTSLSVHRRAGLTGVSKAPTSHWSRHLPYNTRHVFEFIFGPPPPPRRPSVAQCAVLPPLSPITRDNVQITPASLTALKFANKPACCCLCLRFLAPVVVSIKPSLYGWYSWVFLNYWYTWKQVLGAVNNESVFLAIQLLGSMTGQGWPMAYDWQ